MIFALYRDALQIIKNNKGFILLFLFTCFSSIPRSEDANFSLWAICGAWPVTLFLSLYLELYLIWMIVKYKDPLNQIDPPLKLAQKYIWKSLLVGIVTFFWMLIILGLPYVLIDVIRDLISGIMLWGVDFVWCILLNLITFGLFNLGMIVLATKHSLALESPALGLMEIIRNFRHYLKVYMFTVLVSYIPLFTLMIFLTLREGIGRIAANSSLSFNPYESAFELMFYSDAKLIFVLVFIGLYMIQRVVLTLSYFSRPELSGNNLVKSTSV